MCSDQASLSTTISNKQEFESLFRAHYAPLVGYASKLLGDADSAADVVQQLFVNIWDKQGSLEIEGSTKSYLLRSTHNACLNAIKHEKVKAEHSAQSLFGASETEQRDLLEEEEFNLKVRTAVQSLPTQCRKIFLMSRLQGKKYQQIADELSLSVKTVENQMGKALRTLRDELREEQKTTMRLVKSILWFLIGVNVFSIVMK